MDYDSTNVFARIIRGEIAASKIYEDDFILAIKDIAPAAPVHILIIPKGEYRSFQDFVLTAPSEIQGSFFASIAMLAKKLDIAESGYRLITNHGENAAQSVAHFHVHLLGGRKMGALLA